MDLGSVLDRIERRLKVLGMSADAASRVARKPDAIRNIRRAVKSGQRQGVTVATLDALADALQTPRRWLHEGAGPEDRASEQHMVPLVGYVGAGAETHFFGEQQELDRVPPPNPERATENTVAAEIRGDSLGPFFNGWVVSWNDVRRPVTTDLVGEICVVGLEDGRVLVKKLQRSKTRGLFHLLSQFEPPILDVPVDWAAEITGMAPRRRAARVKKIR